MHATTRLLFAIAVGVGGVVLLRGAGRDATADADASISESAIAREAQAEGARDGRETEGARDQAARDDERETEGARGQAARGVERETEGARDQAARAEKPEKPDEPRVEDPRAALARLLAVDLPAAPDDAPAAIHDLAALARDAGPREREDAARTLTRWLREETRRDAADARGNVPNLIEALGELGGDRAVSTLVDALADERHDLALKTLIVQQLGALDEAPDDPRALRAVERFALVAENAAVRDDFDAELRAEALAAAAESGRRLRR